MAVNRLTGAPQVYVIQTEVYAIRREIEERETGQPQTRKGRTPATNPTGAKTSATRTYLLKPPTAKISLANASKKDQLDEADPAVPNKLYDKDLEDQGRRFNRHHIVEDDADDEAEEDEGEAMDDAEREAERDAEEDDKQSLEGDKDDEAEEVFAEDAAGEVVEEAGKDVDAADEDLDDALTFKMAAAGSHRQRLCDTKAAQLARAHEVPVESKEYTRKLEAGEPMPTIQTRCFKAVEAREAGCGAPEEVRDETEEYQVHPGAAERLGRATTQVEGPKRKETMEKKAKAQQEEWQRHEDDRCAAGTLGLTT